ncbi:MAG TPA: hypothetical protein VE053_08325 [Allosphingosinicella sp.]|nr:hypothetical protein [Allosphingosinicella sp.]
MQKLCNRLRQLQDAREVDLKNLRVLEGRTGLPAWIAGLLLAGFIGGLAGRFLSRRGSAKPADPRRGNSGPGGTPPPSDVHPDYDGLVDGQNKLATRHDQLAAALQALTGRIERLQVRFDSLQAPRSDSSNAAAVRERSAGMGEVVRSDYVSDTPATRPSVVDPHPELPARSFANPEVPPPPPPPPPPPVNRFPGSDALIAAYRELITRNIVSQSDYETILGQYGDLATVALDDGRLLISSAFGAGDAEKKLVAVIASDRETAILFPSRTYLMNFLVNFAGLSQAGQEIVAAFDLDADGTGGLSYRTPAIARIRADDSLDIVNKGRLGGYTS